MVGNGHGMKEVGRIIHSNSDEMPASKNEALLDQARTIGRLLTEEG